MSKITHILLALPCPYNIFNNKSENFVADFLRNRKTPRFMEEVIEAEINEGSLKMHNLLLFPSQNILDVKISL